MVSRRSISLSSFLGPRRPVLETIQPLEGIGQGDLLLGLDLRGMLVFPACSRNRLGFISKVPASRTLHLEFGGVGLSLLRVPNPHPREDGSSVLPDCWVWRIGVPHGLLVGLR